MVQVLQRLDSSIALFIEKWQSGLLRKFAKFVVETPAGSNPVFSAEYTRSINWENGLRLARKKPCGFESRRRILIALSSNG